MCFFSLQVGHLHAGCSKEVTVTFCSSKPVTLTSQPMKCKVVQVEFQQPVEQVADWDDRQRTVQWLTSSTQASRAPEEHVTNKVNMLTLMLKRVSNQQIQLSKLYTLYLHTGDKDRS